MKKTRRKKRKTKREERSGIFDDISANVSTIGSDYNNYG